jgi:hypothetical protein
MNYNINMDMSIAAAPLLAAEYKTLTRLQDYAALATAAVPARSARSPGGARVASRLTLVAVALVLQRASAEVVVADVSFKYSGATQVVRLPANCINVTASVWGASGAPATSGCDATWNTPGKGAFLMGTFACDALSTLFVVVGRRVQPGPMNLKFMAERRG